MKRKPLTKSASRKTFRKGASTHIKNLLGNRGMRGGIRL